MTPGRIMLASGLVLGGLGLALLFAPVELAPVLGLGAGPGSGLAVQLFGSCLLAVGTMNWMGRGGIYGGIYGRPMAFANFFLAMLCVLGLGQTTAARGGPPGAWVLTAVFAADMAAFAWIVFFSRPWKGKGGG
ncbi:MAG: hypothetical protein PVJ02_05335 [Gemmatimonadota bacterium]|jgi:hypothetical protein